MQWSFVLKSFIRSGIPGFRGAAVAESSRSVIRKVRHKWRGCGSPVVKVSNHGRHVMSSIPVPLKTRRVGQRCTLNLSRAETSSRCCARMYAHPNMNLKMPLTFTFTRQTSPVFASFIPKVISEMSILTLLQSVKLLMVRCMATPPAMRLDDDDDDTTTDVM
ncbi:hypothetical protein TNCV_4859661 [Trichonephila clavipes]|nr:hypothetical protein TNCV_4859661 [Trichonephila clavipes]